MCSKIQLPGGLVRAIRSPDATPGCDGFVAYRRDPQIARFQSWDTNYTRDDALRLIGEQARLTFPSKGTWMQFAVRSSGGELLGDLAVHAVADQPDTYELGITVKGTAQGKGFASAALGATVEYLFTDARAHRLFATCDERNHAVRRLLSRTGLRWEGTARCADWFKGEWTTVETWALLADDWYSSREGLSLGGK